MKASLTVIQPNDHLRVLQMDIIDNENIALNEENKGGLHLNPKRFGKLVVNFIRRIKKFTTTWRVTGSFHMTSSFNSQINSRCFNSLGNIEKSDKSALSRLTGFYSTEKLKNDLLNDIHKKTQSAS